MILSVLNQKGGVGKTTLSVSLATAFALDGKRVILVDADPQHSALDWSAARGEDVAPLFPVVGMPKATIHKDLPVLAADYDIVVIDGPPRVNELARSAIMASDQVLIPVQPSPYDVWAASEILELLREAAVFRPLLKCSFVINRKITNTAIGRDVTDALAQYDTPVLDTHVAQRVVFAESAAAGLTVLETDPTGPAAAEIRALAAQLVA